MSIFTSIASMKVNLNKNPNEITKNQQTINSHMKGSHPEFKLRAVFAPHKVDGGDLFRHIIGSPCSVCTCSPNWDTCAILLLWKTSRNATRITWTRVSLSGMMGRFREYSVSGGIRALCFLRLLDWILWDFGLKFRANLRSYGKKLIFCMKVIRTELQLLK